MKTNSKKGKEAVIQAYILPRKCPYVSDFTILPYKYLVSLKRYKRLNDSCNGAMV